MDNWGKGYVKNLAIDARIVAGTTENFLLVIFQLTLEYFLNKFIT